MKNQLEYNVNKIKSIVPNENKSYELETINKIATKLAKNNISISQLDATFTDSNISDIGVMLNKIETLYCLFIYDHSHDTLKQLKKYFESTIEFIYNDELVIPANSKEVQVYNDDELVFDGLMSEFIAHNDNDEFLTDILNTDKNIIEFNEHSGKWRIEVAV